MKFILLFSQQHTDFRLAEFKGICRVFDIHFDFGLINAEEHIFVVDFPSEAPLRQILSRSILLKSAYRFMYSEPCYDAMVAALKETGKELFAPYERADTTFAVRVRPVGRKKGLYGQNICREFAGHIPLSLPSVDLQQPAHEFTYIELYAGERAEKAERCYLGELVGHGAFKYKVEYSLKTRKYIGNTTMDPELAFIQSNITCVRPGAVVMDPFCGTGGLILPAAEFGGLVMGAEINYQIARGMGKSSRVGEGMLTDEQSIRANFEQYGTADRFLGVMIADASRHAIWPDRTFIDVIVADPPYGFREKGRKVGPKERKEHWTLPGAEPGEDYIHFPEKQVYQLGSVFSDLCDLAATRLTIGGRVSFWYPVVREDYSPSCLPHHPALELVENCEQTLTRKTARRLLTYEKTRAPLEGEKAGAKTDPFADGNKYRDTLAPAAKVARVETD